MRRTALAVTAVAVAVFAGATSSPPPALATQWLAAWNSHDVERVLPLFTADVTYEEVAFGALNHGATDMRKFAAFFFSAVPDMKFELSAATVQGRHGSIEWIFTGTDVGIFKTGKPFKVRGVSVIDLDARGTIAVNRDYYDAASIMRQVGILPDSE